MKNEDLKKILKKWVNFRVFTVRLSVKRDNKGVKLDSDKENKIIFHRKETEKKK